MPKFKTQKEATEYIESVIATGKVSATALTYNSVSEMWTVSGAKDGKSVDEKQNTMAIETKKNGEKFDHGTVSYANGIIIIDAYLLTDEKNLEPFCKDLAEIIKKYDWVL